MKQLKELFLEDLQKIYMLLLQRQKELNSFYEILEKNIENNSDLIDNFLKDINLPINKETKLSAINRLVNLRDESLVQELQKANFNEKEIDDAKEKAYIWTSNYHLTLHEKLLHKIESLKLLTPFYRTVLKGVHKVGLDFTKWQSLWTSHIITGINRELYRLFNGDEEKIYQMLNEKKLFEVDEEGNKADRSYSVLIKKGREFFHLSYKEAFPKEVDKISKNLETLILQLSVLEDEIYDLKNEHIEYFQAIVAAINETDRKKLIKRWADVDRAWMKITSPIQVGHPLEYYEDHYRKAVALEWDVRIADPNKTSQSDTKEKIKDTFLTLFDKLGSNKQENIKNVTLKNLDKIQLYIGKPMLYYGAEFNGLFSAQVVPNDENVSSETGKKIFAFADTILESQRAKPTMKITQIIFGDDFIKEQKELLFKKADIWHKIYDITTIGHEFGHILWMDKDSETLMNKTGNFKNIEEFKATTGGLVSFFYNESLIFSKNTNKNKNYEGFSCQRQSFSERNFNWNSLPIKRRLLDEKDELKSYILKDITKRAIGLIAWMQTGEVEPYYCEGLIHLDILFQSGVLDFDKSLSIDFSESAYQDTAKLYKERYNELAKHYLDKKDATEFLNRFAQKEGNYFLPVDKKVRSFVDYYWNLYKEIGRVVA